MKITLLLADDHQLVRDGLCALLAKERGFEVVGEAADGTTAVRLALELKPHVVMMDVAMPDLSGIEATKQIVAGAPGTRVLALSMYSDRQLVTEMLGAGAAGYLLKDSAFEELARAIREVAAGRTYLTPRVRDIIVEDYVRRVQGQVSDTGKPLLTEREREVVHLLAEGGSAKEIAAHLGVSAKTVETHRQHIMEKLETHSVADLTKYAIREGLTSLDL